jgi:predicted small secreted protein
MRRNQGLGKHVARIIAGICLLSFLLSICSTGCGIGQPPVKTLEQWQADINRTRSRE